MGGELFEQMGLWSPKDGWETSQNPITAGSYRAIGLNLQGANPQQAAKLKQQLEATKAKLESTDQVQLATLTKHHLVGDLLYGTVFNYFAMNDLQDQVAAQSAGILSYRLPSYGTFSTNMQTQYWFGLPRNVNFAGLSMDIDHLKQHHVAKNSSREESIAFSQSIGARMSAMEHLIPEQMFSTEAEKAQGISAVKALAIASQQGQKIWTIDQNNVELALSRMTLGIEAENDIRNAVNAGKIATAHENRINFNGWVGEGYTLIDPRTGAGAYMIAGGGNGGELKAPVARLLHWDLTTPISSNELEPVIENETMVLAAAQRGALDGVAKFFDCYKDEAKQLSIIAFAVIAALALAAVVRVAGIAGAAALAGVGRVAAAIVMQMLSALFPPAALAAASTKEECECESGITSRAEGYIQCWVCSADAYPEITGRTKAAKAKIESLQKCHVPPIHTVADLYLRISAFEEGISARQAENICWEPRGVGHQEQVAAYVGGVERCFRILRKNHGIQ
jgi:hypothetical protein